jgi:SAM-dependent methyltransferase
MRGLEQVPWLYDACMLVMDRLGLRRWRAWLTRGAAGPTLEVGCGTGRNLGLYPQGVTLVGCEPERATLAKAKALHPAALLVRASAEALPFRDGAFDTVVSSLVFCSVPRPAVGLAEVRRVLAPNGRLRMLEHVRSTSRLGGWWQDLIQPLWTRASGGCHPNRHTEAAVEAAGFVIEAEGRRSRGTLRRFVARSSEGDAHQEAD